MRVITALALVVVNVGLGWLCAASASAGSDGGEPPLFSQCYTLTLSPPGVAIKPSVTVCAP